ncbi:hypothetical protein F5887DRAFT_1160736 [Amanita rubescens]|nr:hypothetical protein F5887DRAFT_1160736 [Amanita rubescens]
MKWCSKVRISCQRREVTKVWTNTTGAGLVLTAFKSPLTMKARNTPADFADVIFHVPPETTLVPPLAPLKHSSTFFTGRGKYLQRLKDHFGAHEAGQRKSFLLHGLGGIGKTQICLKFIEQNPDLFSDILWIDASSEATIEVGLIQIAHANNAPPEAKQSAGDALKWISHRSKWLMIYDGADGHYSVIEKFLPPGNGGNIMITSRNVGLKRLTLDSMIVLDMADDEAVPLLLKSAMLDGTSDNIKNRAQKVALELGGIPLALDQAGGYIQSCGCSIDDYFELFNKHKHELLSKKGFKGASGYGMSTYGTWDISMQQINNMAASTVGEEAEAADSAIRLLRIFAFLNHENIPEELFKNAAKNYIQRNVKGKKSDFLFSVNLLNHQTLFLSEDGEWDRMQFLDGIQVLLSFSLVKTVNQLYSMHLLVNNWSRGCVPKIEVENHYIRARALLSCSILYDWNIDNYEFCRLLAPHIRSNCLLGLELKLNSQYYDDEYEQFALVFDHIGSWDEKEKLLHVMVHERTTKLGSDHPDTLNSMNNLALTYSDQGRWDEAEKLQMDVMNAFKTKLGSDHPDTLTIMGNLAFIYMNQGRWDEAEKLQMDVMNAFKTKLGSDHPDTLTIMANVASTYMHQGRWDEAEKLQMDVMNATKRKLGSDHPDTLIIMGNLALTYQTQGRWDEAEKLQMDVMNARKTKLGSDHPETLASMNNLALTYRDQGRLDEAEKLQMDVVNATKRKLGSDHPNTLTSMTNLASTYIDQGRWDEAEKLQMDVMNTTKRKLGSDHPVTLTIMDNLALTYWNQGRWDEAGKLGLNAINAKTVTPDSGHLDATLTSVTNQPPSNQVFQPVQQDHDQPESMSKSLGIQHAEEHEVICNLQNPQPFQRGSTSGAGAQSGCGAHGILSLHPTSHVTSNLFFNVASQLL